MALGGVSENALETFKETVPVTADGSGWPLQSLLFFLREI